MSHLHNIVSLTNVELSCRNKPATNVSEILRYFGVLVSLSRFEFGVKRDLWSPSSKKKYLPVTNFGCMMPYHRSDMLRCCIRYSSCGESGNNDGAFNWCALVDDFMKSINDHRELYVTPSELICVDGSMSHWYGLGGDWIDMELLMYRAINRKP